MSGVCILYKFSQSLVASTFIYEFSLLQEIQESLLPPSVHIYSKKAPKVSQKLTSDGKDDQRIDKISNSSASMIGPSSSGTENSSNGSLKRSDMLSSEKNCGPRSLSPYPNV